MTTTERSRDGKTVTESIAGEVKKLRTKEGLSLTAIASKLGVSKATVSAAAKITGTEFSAASTRELTEAVISGARLRRARLAAAALALAGERLSLVKGADATEGKNYALTFAVLVDKALLLEGRETADHAAAVVAEMQEQAGGLFGLGW
jgi:transcriptional regulator with XRE-family HTH domain